MFLYDVHAVDQLALIPIYFIACLFILQTRYHTAVCPSTEAASCDGAPGKKHPHNLDEAQMKFCPLAQIGCMLAKDHECS